MSANAGQTLGELPEATTTAVVLDALRVRMGDAAFGEVVAQVEDAPLRVPLQGLVQVLANLVQNALQASPAGAEQVVVRFDVVGGTVRFTVQDRGRGIRRADLDRVGEPFFTTKPPGQGMGLGLFLARAFAERQGGQLVVTSEDGKGTRVTLELPEQNVR